MSQSTLVSKLCALAQHHPTRKAIFEFDKLILASTRSTSSATRSCSAISAGHKTASKPTISCARPSHSGRQKTADLKHRPRCRHHQPVRPADRQCRHRLYCILLSTLLERSQAANDQKQTFRCRISHPWPGNISNSLAATCFAATIIPSISTHFSPMSLLV